MSKHTPGPWTTDEQEHDAPYQNIKIKAGSHRTVCTIWIDDAPVRDFNAEQTANASLIAAAPDLLDALKTAKWMLERDYIDDQKMRVIEKCDAAIAKATGEKT